MIPCSHENFSPERSRAYSLLTPFVQLTTQAVLVTCSSFAFHVAGTQSRCCFSILLKHLSLEVSPESGEWWMQAAWFRGQQGADVFAKEKWQKDLCMNFPGGWGVRRWTTRDLLSSQSSKQWEGSCFRPSEVALMSSCHTGPNAATIGTLCALQQPVFN